MSRYTHFLGVDPGLQGALALYSPSDGHRGVILDMPTKLAPSGGRQVDPGGVSSAVLQLLDLADVFTILGAVELVGGRPRQAGVFAFGLGTGIVHGVLAAHHIPFQQVSPSLWKPSMGLTRRPDETQEDTKDRARELASKLFPELAPQFARKKDDGRAEAMLLAYYIAQRHQKESK